MAGAAGLPLLHFRHGITFSLGTGGKDLVVAVVAFVHAGVKSVAEFDFPGIGQIENHRFRAVVAPVTTTGNIESYIAVMTGTAGAILLHLPHGKATAPFPSGENSAMAIGADIHLLLYIGMYLVAEKRRNLLEAYVRQAFVAFLTVPLDRKCFSAVMTAAARPAGLHVPHQVTFAVRPGDE